jgi:hypothetical protein
MNYSYPADRPENKQSARPSSFDPAAPRKVLVTKTQDIIHEETWYVSDKKLDKWQQGERFYFKAPGLSFWAAYDQASQKNNLTLDPKLLPFPKTGFRGLDWIGTQTYAGTMKSDKGNLLLVFVPQNADKLDVNDAKALERQSLIAYIDVETRLPSIVRERNVVCTYAFYPPPGTIQALPPDLAAEIKAGDEKRAKLNSAPVKEY